MLELTSEKNNEYLSFIAPELKGYKMLFQLRVFNRICKHHIDTSYIYDLKCQFR